MKADQYRQYANGMSRAARWWHLRPLLLRPKGNSGRTARAVRSQPGSPDALPCRGKWETAERLGTPR
jgi:hypothetical protein